MQTSRQFSRTCFLLALLPTCLLQAGPVTEWNEAARAAIRAARSNPPVASRGLAMLHVAIHDAVNGVQRTHRPYHVTDHAPAGASLEAAVSGAAYEVLRHLFSSSDIQRTNLDVVYLELVAAVPEGPAKQDGLLWGQQVGAAILALRASDGSTETVDYTPGDQPGVWRPTPPAHAAALLPHWGQVTPFALTSAAQFRPHAPPPVGSSAYAFELNIVKAYGGATGSMRSADQSQIAEFWANGAGTETPPGHWNRIAVQVAQARGLSTPEEARLLALLNVALADAAISCWEAKYMYDYWRPVTAIREADPDSTPEIVADPNWSSFVVTPPFPEYTSGHSMFSRAAATLLARYFGTDAIAFTVGSDELPGVMRSYAGFAVASDESAVSRVYGGIHFPSAIVTGQAAGHLLAEHVWTHYLQPLEAPTFVLVSPAGAEARIQLLGEPGRSYRLEACPDLREWVMVGTATAGTDGIAEFTDPASAGEAKRFYRATAQ
jgi:membrane-associated phospholipid phosphatase